MSIRPIRVEVTNVFRSDRSWKRRCRDGLQAHHWRSAYLPKSRKSPTLPYDCPITPLSLLSSLMLLSAILVLLLIHISHSPTTSPTSPVPASCDLRRIRHMFDFKTASIIATSIVNSKLDYCNSLFLNLSTRIQGLQLIQNSLARAVTRTHRRHHNTSVLKSLHWLKILERIHLKVLSLTCNFLQYTQPTYLRELFTIRPTHSTRSSSCLTLSRPLVTSHLTFSNRAISITASCRWNDLPSELRTFSLPPSSLQITKHHLH